MNGDAWSMVDVQLENIFRAATFAAEKDPCMLRRIETYASRAYAGEDIQLVDIMDVSMRPSDRCVTFEVGLIRWDALDQVYDAYDGYPSDNDVTLQCENDMENFFGEIDVEEFIRVPMEFKGASKEKGMSLWKLLREIKISSSVTIPDNSTLFLPNDSTMLHKLGFWVDDIVSFNNNMHNFEAELETFEAAALLSMSK